MSKYAESVLAGVSLEELRAIAELAQQQLYDRRCQSHLSNIGSCTGQPPHEDGWHECATKYAAAGAPAHTATPHPVWVRWRFDDDTVAAEHAHEARRRPGAN